MVRTFCVVENEACLLMLLSLSPGTSSYTGWSVTGSMWVVSLGGDDLTGLVLMTGITVCGWSAVEAPVWRSLGGFEGGSSESGGRRMVICTVLG